MTHTTCDIRHSLPDRITHPNYTATKVAETRLYTRDKNNKIKDVGALVGLYRPDGQPDPDIEDLNEIFSKKRPLTIAVDAEWVSVGEGDKARRVVLSQQYSFRVGGVRYDVVVVFTTNIRFTLNTLLGAVVDFALTLLPKQPEPVKSVKGKKSAKGKVALHINLLGHYGIVDFSTFYRKNRQSGFMKQTEGIRRTLATFDPVNIKTFDTNRNEKYTLKTQLRDTMLLAPAGAQSLAKLGETMNFPKLELTGGFTKSEMDILMKKDPDQFLAYALTDTAVTLAWAEVNFGSNTEIPTTIGSIGAKKAREHIMTSHGWNIEAFDFHWRGMDTSFQPKPPGARRRWQPDRILTPRPDALDLINKATAAFYGGRNECFAAGIHHGDWFDYDVAGAYATSMAIVPDPDFEVTPSYIHGSLSLANISPVSYGFGFIDFEFPEDTQYPCLPVKDTSGKGLIFPLRGSCYASSPEIYLALQMGAKVRSNSFIVQPATRTNSLLEVMRHLTNLRAKAAGEHGKGSPQELFQKEVTNSVYGKIGQGLAGKRNYSVRRDEYQDSPPSAITSAPQAALITGLVRAMVSAALVELGAAGYRVLSVTTDGFITDAPFDFLDSRDLFGFADLFRNARGQIAPSPAIWETKHDAESMVMFKTRGGSGQGVTSAKLPIARAGYKFSPDDHAAFASGSKNEFNEMARLYLTRKGKVPMTFTKLPSIVDYFRRDADGLAVEVSKTLSLEYDFKRNPVEPTLESIEIEGVRYDHVSFHTRPWSNMSEFTRARKSLGDMVLKTPGNMAEHVSRQLAHSSGVRTSGGLDKTKARSLLRGLRQGLLTADWITPTTKSPAILDRVSKVCGGVTLTPNDWKKANLSDRAAVLPLDSLASEIESLGAHIIG